MGVFLLPENPAFRRTARSRPHPSRIGMRAALFLAPAYSPLRSCSRAASGVLSPLATAVTAS